MWCELLSEALAALWTSSVTSDPNLWLKWDPLRPVTQPVPKLHHGADNMVLAFNISCSVIIKRNFLLFNTSSMLFSGTSLAE